MKTVDLGKRNWITQFYQANAGETASSAR